MKTFTLLFSLLAASYVSAAANYCYGGGCNGYCDSGECLVNDNGKLTYYPCGAGSCASRNGLPCVAHSDQATNCPA